MVTAAGVRIGWVDLPDRVRRAVERIVGGPVVEAVSQVGGFSPGTADRVRTADGRRAFVKAAGSALNEHTPAMHRGEAVITAALPASAPTPVLLGSYDDGEWVALVLEEVDGHMPSTPWQEAELALVRAALDVLATTLTPAPVEVPTARELLAEDFAGWQRMRDDPPATTDPWVAAHLPDLCALAAHGELALAGDTLCHTDIRADNLLIGPGGAVTVVDWPLACRGPAWLDSLLLLINVRLYGGSADLATIAADPHDVTGALAGFGGFFADIARRPAPPGLPTVRAFQQAQADVVVSWLRELSD
jgi:aminoglycoside phosphotransferase (APT) family kinase protein